VRKYQNGTEEMVDLAQDEDEREFLEER